MLILLKGQPAWLELDLKTKSVVKLKLIVQGLHQHLADPPLPRGTTLGVVTRPSQASPRKAEQTVTHAQDLEAFKADMTLMLSDMLQASFNKFASQFKANSGGQGNTAKGDTDSTVDVASDNDDSPHRGPEDQSEGEVTDSEGEPDPTATGLPTLEQLKMFEEEQ